MIHIVLAFNVNMNMEYCCEHNHQVNTFIYVLTYTNLHLFDTWNIVIFQLDQQISTFIEISVGTY